MPTVVATARATVLASARAWFSSPGAEVPTPPVVHLPDADDPDLTVWVANHHCQRLGLLSTATSTSKIAGPLDDAHTWQVEVSTADRGIAALRRPDGTWATSENESVEIHVYRKHRIIEQFCITHVALASDGQSATLTLVDVSWYLQQRRRGAVQARNLADLAHWNGQDPSDGLFDGALSGWGVWGGATASAVTEPDSPVIDFFAPWTAKVNAPGGTYPATGAGLYRIIDATQTVAGQPWRLVARNWHPADQDEFLFETSLRLVYMPPGVTDPNDPACTVETYSWDPTTTPHVRDQWVTWTVDVGVPVNTGGHLFILLLAPEHGHTFYGSRWKVQREDVLGTIDLTNLDLPGTVAATVIGDLALPGDTPYRNLHVDGSSPAGARLRPRYPDIEAHSPWDILQTTLKQGGVNMRWDYTPARRTLRVGNLYETRWAWPVMLDLPAGRLEAWEADAGQARNRVRYQGLQNDWSRDQQAAIAVPRRGAVIDDVITAPRQMVPYELFMAAARHLEWSKETPQQITGSLPGDAIHECRPGDLHPVAVRLDDGVSLIGLLRSTSLDYDPVTDRCSVALAPWTPTDAT